MSAFTRAYAEGMSASRRKQELKALKKTPQGSRYVLMDVTTVKERDAFLDRGWDMVKDNRFDGGVWKAWVRITTMRKRRTSVIYNIIPQPHIWGPMTVEPKMLVDDDTL